MGQEHFFVCQIDDAQRSQSAAQSGLADLARTKEQDVFP
jgi:hypothetical protein